MLSESSVVVDDLRVGVWGVTSKQEPIGACEAKHAEKTYRSIESAVSK